MNENTDVRVIRLAPHDVTSSSDHLRSFQELILANEEQYPAIKTWLREKVFDGVRTGERVAFIGYHGSRPAISAVVKRGVTSKFCHLRISDALQNLNLGEMFFSMMATEVKRFAAEVHFTLPESLWSSKAHFFKDFGFSSVDFAAKQYRSGETELRCSAPFSKVWKATRAKLPKLARMFRSGGYQLDLPLLLSIQPKFASAIFSGSKRFEIRRRFSHRWKGARAAVLATRPMHALLGEVTIAAVQQAAPSVIWDHLGDYLGCSEADFRGYCAGATEVFAIEMSDVTPYLSPVPIAQLRHLLDINLSSPQSYGDLDHSSDWREAVSFAAMLHASVTLRPDRQRKPQATAITLPQETLGLFSRV
jgi:predicted transcriptional regulator